MTILISDNGDFKKLRRAETLHIDKMVNSPKRQSNPKYVCTKSKASKYIKQKWTELKDVDKSTILVQLLGYFNTPLRNQQDK